jgi:hypothetical protein
MAYTKVPTKSTGDLWTAADHNTYIKNNFAAGVPDIFTTKGDIAVATAANIAARLEVGTDGQMLVADSSESTGMKWTDDPLADIVTTKGDILAATAADTLTRLAVGTDNQFLMADSSQSTGLGWSSIEDNAARYEVSGAKTIANTTLTIINFDTSVYDPGSAVTTGAAWKYTVPAGQGGIYFVCASVLFQSSANWGKNEYCQLKIYINGALFCSIAEMYMQAAGTYNVFLSGGSIVDLDAADYLDIRCYQNSGDDLLTSADGDCAHVAIARMF